MSFFHLNRSNVSRAKGASSVAKASYMLDMQLRDERTGKTYSYLTHEERVDWQICAPDNCPEWVYDPKELWSRVEVEEDRIIEGKWKSEKYQEWLKENALTSSSYIVALPNSLSEKDNKDILNNFANRAFVSKELIAMWAMHEKGGNIHGHFLTTNRAIDVTTGEFNRDRKDRTGQTAGSLVEVRKIFADCINEKYAELGLNDRVSHKSFKDLGVELAPSRKKGYWSCFMEQNGYSSRIATENKVIAAENAVRILENPSVLVNLVASRKAVFTRQDLYMEAYKRLGGDEKLFTAFYEKAQGLEIDFASVGNKGFDGQEKVVDAGKVVSDYLDNLLENDSVTLGKTEQGEKVYTSHEVQQREAEIFNFAKELEVQKDHGELRVELAIEVQSRKLSGEQADVVRELCGESKLAILQGRAGSGKTTILKAVVDAYQDQGYRVIGTSFTARCAEELELKTGVEGRTLDSLINQWRVYEKANKDWEDCLSYREVKYAEAVMWETGRDQLNDKTIVILDEANMVGSRHWHELLSRANEAGAKVIAVGDTAQLSSIESGDIFRGLQERHQYSELTEIFRQRLGWMREASQMLSDGMIEDGLKKYWDMGQIHLSDRPLHDLAKHYAVDYGQGQGQLALAVRNSDVRHLNTLIRENLVNDGHLKGNDYRLNGQDYRVGERIIFLQNDHRGDFVSNVRGSDHESTSVGVNNGTFGQIMEFDKGLFGGQIINVRLDDGRLVSFNPTKYDHFDYGYAITVMKSEGITADKDYYLIGVGDSQASTVVACTRPREELNVYGSKAQLKDFRGVLDNIRSNYSPLVSDWTVSEENRPYFNRVSMYVDMGLRLQESRDYISTEKADEYRIADRFKDDVEYAKELTIARNVRIKNFKRHNDLKGLRSEVAREIVEDWGRHKLYAAQLGLKREFLEEVAGLRERPMREIELQAKEEVREYMGLERERMAQWENINKTHPHGLAVLHEDFEEYKDLDNKLKEMGQRFVEVPSLYSKFFNVGEKDGKKYDTFGIQINEANKQIYYPVYQAAKHRMDIMEKAYYKHLDREQLLAYADIKQYKVVSGIVGSIAHLYEKNPALESITSSNTSSEAYVQDSTLRSQRVINPSTGTKNLGSNTLGKSEIDWENLNKSKHSALYRTYEKQRDEIAHKIITNYGDYKQPLGIVFGMDKKHEKLLTKDTQISKAHIEKFNSFAGDDNVQGTVSKLLDRGLMHEARMMVREYSMHRGQELAKVCGTASEIVNILDTNKQGDNATKFNTPINRALSEENIDRVNLRFDHCLHLSSLRGDVNYSARGDWLKYRSALKEYQTKIEIAREPAINEGEKGVINNEIAKDVRADQAMFEVSMHAHSIMAKGMSTIIAQDNGFERIVEKAQTYGVFMDVQASLDEKDLIKAGDRAELVLEKYNGDNYAKDLQQAYMYFKTSKNDLYVISSIGDLVANGEISGRVNSVKIRKEIQDYRKAAGRSQNRWQAVLDENSKVLNEKHIEQIGIIKNVASKLNQEQLDVLESARRQVRHDHIGSYEEIQDKLQSITDHVCKSKDISLAHKVLQQDTQNQINEHTMMYKNENNNAIDRIRERSVGVVNAWEQASGKAKEAANTVYSNSDTLKVYQETFKSELLLSRAKEHGVEQAIKEYGNETGKEYGNLYRQAGLGAQISEQLNLESKKNRYVTYYKAKEAGLDLENVKFYGHGLGLNQDLAKVFESYKDIQAQTKGMWQGAKESTNAHEIDTEISKARVGLDYSISQIGGKESDVESIKQFSKASRHYFNIRFEKANLPSKIDKEKYVEKSVNKAVQFKVEKLYGLHDEPTKAKELTYEITKLEGLESHKNKTIWNAIDNKQVYGELKEERNKLASELMENKEFKHNGSHFKGIVYDAYARSRDHEFKQASVALVMNGKDQELCRMAGNEIERNSTVLRSENVRDFANRNYEEFTKNREVTNNYTMQAYKTVAEKAASYLLRSGDGQMEYTQEDKQIANNRAEYEETRRQDLVNQISKGDTDISNICENNMYAERVASVESRLMAENIKTCGVVEGLDINQYREQARIEVRDNQANINELQSNLEKNYDITDDISFRTARLYNNHCERFGEAPSEQVVGSMIEATKEVEKVQMEINQEIKDNYNDKYLNEASNYGINQQTYYIIEKSSEYLADKHLEGGEITEDDLKEAIYYAKDNFDRHLSKEFTECMEQEQQLEKERQIEMSQEMDNGNGGMSL